MAQRLLIDNKLEGGLQDYSLNLMEADQFYSHTNNQPATFSFRLQDLSDPDFVVPTRGSYVSFEDDRWESRDPGVPDWILFTGYISDDPAPVYLGTKNGVKVWAYDCTATSDDYLPQIKELPARTYVNKTRGYIIRDLVAEMLKNNDTLPIDVSGVLDGGIERLYQTERTTKFADVLAAFAKADGFRYRILNGKLFYGPEEEYLPHNSDPEVKLVIDDSDPRFSPWALRLERVATSIANDVTVYGEDEPTTLVTEHYVSDGYMGEFPLTFKPYGVVEKVLVEDDLTAPTFDTALWQEADDPLALTGIGDGSYLQLFEGSFNVVGGPTPGYGDLINNADPGITAPTVYLRSRRGVELAGIIETRDCELFFPPETTLNASGLIGGLFTDETMSFFRCFSGWMVGVANVGGSPPIIFSVANGALTDNWVACNINYHYMLRRRFEFDIPIGQPVIRRGPLETEAEFGGSTKPNGCFITYTVDEINATDPQNIVTKTIELAKVRVENAPDFALYAPVVSWNLHCVLNFCRVARPQQARLTVDDKVYKLGPFMDGGVATITVEEERAKLNWYSVPTSTDGPPIVPPDTPFVIYSFAEPGGDFITSTGSDITSNWEMSVQPSVSPIPGFAPNSDMARNFQGYIGGFPAAIQGPRFGNPGATLPLPFTIRGWLKTTSAYGGIFNFSRNDAMPSVGLAVVNGRLRSRIQHPENAVYGATAINDGARHHFAWTFDNSTACLYIDGVLDGSGPGSLSAAPYADSMANPWDIGRENAYWPSSNSYEQIFYVGDLDDIIIDNVAKTADEIKTIYQEAVGPAPPPPPLYNPQTGTTIPPKGSIVEITYYRAQKSRARVKNLESIATERAKFGDDGIRQATILENEVTPTPRSSEECQYLAQAYLADRATHRYEGDYTFETGERDVTKLVIFPSPGELVPIDVTLPDGEHLDTNLVVTQVASSFIGEGAYSITLTFGPRSRYDEAQRKLMLERKTSLDNPEIKDSETLIAEVINAHGYSIPDDPAAVIIANVTPLTFTVDMNPTRDTEGGGYEIGNGTLPEGVVGYDVRRDDTGWGQPNYVARVSSAVFTLNRGTRDRAYFIRPFNLQGNYSRNSALVRVISPLSNTLVATGLDGDISPGEVRLFIPLVRNPDIGGYLIQKDNADGQVIYQGDGVEHRTVAPGVTVLVESSRITVTIPNAYAVASYTVRVVVYNLLNIFGPETIFTITRQATQV